MLRGGVTNSVKLRRYGYKAEALYPGWLEKLLTTKIHGLENYAEMVRHLTEDKEAIKVFVEVA